MCDPATAMIGSAALSSGTGLLNGLIGGGAAKAASQQQAQLGWAQLMMQAQMQAQMNERLAPFVQGGKNALGALQRLTGTNEGGDPTKAYLTSKFAPTMEQLASTPGYQFTLGQGQKAVTNAAAAKGLGQSGAALRGAVDYAGGLASTTFQQQFQNYLAENAQIYNMINGQTQTGLNAAVQQGAQGNQILGMMTNSLGGIGSALASGTVGQANAMMGGLNALAGGGSNALMLYALGNSGLFGPSGGGSGGMSIANTNLMYPGLNSSVNGGYSIPQSEWW